MIARGRVVAAVIVLAGVVAACRGSVGPPSEPLPAAAPRARALEDLLRDAAARETPVERARARHRRADGSPRFVNRLVLERSPYLRQHAHNPVDWYPWGDEAFAQAKREGKLVLLSVGYATCHWCHVMEEESFEDMDVARRMNADYVAIKVDREERPDVDGTYLRAVSLLTGGGGWPMTIWMTADREVVFAGTYFPPRDGMRGARLGFATLLDRVLASYRADPAAIAEKGRELGARIRAEAVPDSAEAVPGREVLDRAFVQYAAAFDAERGGFGRAPKFPMPSALDFLLRYHRRTATPAALEMVRRTLAAMAAGGVRDQLGGGFHRYSTDVDWRVPHFEKMLYDNAQLATAYLAGWQATGEPEWREVSRYILDDLARTFRDPAGGFYAAVDADDPGGEGAYYTWTPSEVAEVLDSAHAAVARLRWGVADGGPVAGRSVLRVARDWSAVGAAMVVDAARAAALGAEARDRLLAVRARRPAPLVDTKVLAGWNGLAVSAFARAGAVLPDARYVALARDAATFVLDHLTSDGRLLRVHTGRSRGQPAFLEDHAFLIAGLLDLFEATAELRWLEAATRLQSWLDRDHWDGAAGCYFESGADRDPGLPRAKPVDDGALPSGNAIAADNLLRFARLHDDEQARERAMACLRALGGTLTAAPTRAARLLGVVEAALDRPREVVIVAPSAHDAAADELWHAVHGLYLPNRTLVDASESRTLTELQRTLPFVGEKRALDGRATAYVCERGRCLQPTSDPAVLRRQLAAVAPLPGVPGD